MAFVVRDIRHCFATVCACHGRCEYGTVSIKWIAARLFLGIPKSARALLHQWMQDDGTPPNPEPCAQPQFQPMGDLFVSWLCRI
jgi:hypothetical protein